MTDLYQVLRQKEMDLDRLRKEIEALQLVIPLLAEDEQPVSVPVSQSRSVERHEVPQPGRKGKGGAQGWP